MFCLRKDNRKKRLFLLDRQPLSNVSEVRNLTKRHQLFAWPRLKHDRNATTVYHAGDPVLVRYEGAPTFGYLISPSDFAGRDCSADQPVRYMHDRRQECPRKRPRDCSSRPELSAKGYLRGLRIVATPSDTINGSTSDLIIPAVFVCDGQNEETCRAWSEDPLPAPTPDCRDVMMRIVFHVIHDGIQGIRDVGTSVYLGKLDADEGNFVQVIEHKWTWSTDNVTDAGERSGNPGYLLRKPLIVARTKDVEEQTTLTLAPAALSSMAAQPSGFCDARKNDR